MKRKSARELWQMFVIFFKIGAFTIGGGMAMIPVIQKEIVEKQKWMDDTEIVDVFAIVQSLPGVIAINSSIFLGYRLSGIIGGIVAALGVILPSLIIILAIFFLFPAVADNPYVQKAFAGVRAGLVAIIAVTVFKLAKPAIKDAMGILVAVVSFVAITFLKVDIVIVIVGSGLLGLAYYGIKSRIDSKKAGDAK